MSKKKGASRSAMTLKDFHGGSIPSDLPLPSAPGMTVDRSVYERQGSTAWMSPTLGSGYGTDRSGHHRQGSAGGVRTFEDKASYFPNPANIGRNYDEDERKPVESRPRSSHSADRYDEQAYEERRGGYTADRYVVEEQGGFGGGHGFSEQRSSSFSDRFPPSQITSISFESNGYVHDEFGLNPVGPPPSRLIHQETQPVKQLPSLQREVVDTRSEQLHYAAHQQVSNAPPYSPLQQIATSPPQSWRNSPLPIHGSSIISSPPSDSATNIWTARRDGESTRLPVSEKDSLASVPWRPHSTPVKASETTAISKVSSGRWQSDTARLSGPGEKRESYSAEGRRSFPEEPTHKFVTAEAARTGSANVSRGGGYSEMNVSPRISYGDTRLVSTSDEGSLNKLGYRDTSSITSQSGGKVTHVESTRNVYPDRTRQHTEFGEAVSNEAGHSKRHENGRTPISPDAGREFSRSAASGEQSEVNERPKLKLLPRSKPVERAVSLQSVDDETVLNDEYSWSNTHRHSGDKRMPEVFAVDLLTGPGRSVHSELGNLNDEDNEEGNRLVERPKLNLKPRSQPTEADTEEGSQKFRQVVFGGARPRELVLKERGVDDHLNVGLDAQTPVASSAQAIASPAVKWESTVRVEIRGEVKQDSGRQEKSLRRQGSNRADWQDNSRVSHGTENKWDHEKDSQLEQERADSRWKRDFEKQDSRRDASMRRDIDKQDSRRDVDTRRDIDKQESWRRPADTLTTNAGQRPPGLAVSPLLDPSPGRSSGRYGYSSNASAVELAQAFSRSSLTGPAFGTKILRSPISPVPKSSVQGTAPGYENGTGGGPYLNRDSSFSRLAEASIPPFSPTSLGNQRTGVGFGFESQKNSYGSGKLGGHGSGEFKRPDLISGHHLNVDNDDFPGKRGLPIRQNDGYYD